MFLHLLILIREMLGLSHPRAPNGSNGYAPEPHLPALPSHTPCQSGEEPFFTKHLDATVM
jgi:hypothetical protein